MKTIVGAMISLLTTATLCSSGLAAQERHRLTEQERNAEIEKLRAGLSAEEKVYFDTFINNPDKVTPNLVVQEPSQLRQGDFGRLIQSGAGDFDVTQVISDHEMLIWHGAIWVDGANTAGLTDGGRTSPGTVVVSGTKSYTTALGTKRTVLRVVVINRKKVDDVLDKGWELKSFRDWSDAKGEFLFTARFVEFKSGQVHVIPFEHRDDGKTTAVSMSGLSKKDQKWVSDRREEERRKAAKAKKAKAK